MHVVREQLDVVILDLASYSNSSTWMILDLASYSNSSTSMILDLASYASVVYIYRLARLQFSPLDGSA